ncbi:hypothetical protein [Psychroserpens algicola]|uniref:Uncharacterized protein n=1 Tax=Psychroserpens algicola TaxID=1719034 RepID=A0ABT0H5H4_9FLAO|nr:hypothetical protein [Psychroserpens algicola]MCK8479050.1 hypothetical protein [Psychroserpens algicola]
MLVNCSITNLDGQIISVLEDTTETDFIAKVDFKNLTSAYGFENDMWQSAMFRYGTINSLTLNERDETSIESEHSMLGNELERRQLVSIFKQDVEQILHKPKDYSKGQYSSIWRPIVQELEILQAYKEQKSSLYVFSDLQENHPHWFSVYKSSDLKLLKDSPEKVRDLFLKESMGIERHNPNIEVIVVYQPSTTHQDSDFLLLKGLYASIFKELGIRISFTSKI